MHIAGSTFIFNIFKVILTAPSLVWEIFVGAVLRRAFITSVAYTRRLALSRDKLSPDKEDPKKALDLPEIVQEQQGQVE
jgi:hypothetical protein